MRVDWRLCSDKGRHYARRSFAGELRLPHRSRPDRCSIAGALGVPMRRSVDLKFEINHQDSPITRARISTSGIADGLTGLTSKRAEYGG